MGWMMKGSQKLEFVLRRKVHGREVTPKTIGLAMFNQFNTEVEQLIAGSDRKIRLDEVHVEIKEGSYKLLAILPAVVMSTLEPDLRSLTRQDSLGEVDPKRKEIIEKWQSRAKTEDGGKYEIKAPRSLNVEVQITSTTDYHVGKITPWVNVEKYLFGQVVDMGGAQKANVHLALEDTGQTVIVGATQDFLREQQTNRLYHKTLLRVQAEENTRTGALRNVRLIDFVEYDPQYDEQALEQFIEKGTKAWADVPNAAEWVRKLRGGR